MKNSGKFKACTLFCNVIVSILIKKTLDNFYLWSFSMGKLSFLQTLFCHRLDEQQCSLTQKRRSAAICPLLALRLQKFCSERELFRSSGGGGIEGILLNSGALFNYCWLFMLPGFTIPFPNSLLKTPFFHRPMWLLPLPQLFFIILPSTIPLFS